VSFDPHRVGIEAIREAIARAGYAVRCEAQSRAELPAARRGLAALRFLGLLAVVAAVFLLLNAAGRGGFLPSVTANMGYGLIFVVGLITSLHCVAMCGGIAVSQGLGSGAAGKKAGACTEEEPAAGRLARGLLPGLQYNAGRVVAYTLIGGVVGAVGSLFSLSTALKGLIPILAGAFMLVLGVRMLGIFPWLSRLSIRLPRVGRGRLSAFLAGRGPFLVGLANGLMPCGPLQTMQVYALGTGSFLAGALSMFLFSLGTVPLMLGFSAVSSLLSARFTRWMLRASGALVLGLAIVMLGRGMNLFGVSLPSFPAGRSAGIQAEGVQVAGVLPSADPGDGSVSAAFGSQKPAVAKIVGGSQVVTTTLESGQYQPFVVQKGIPVKWTILARAEDLNGCNNPLTVPSYGIRKKLVPGSNLIEFTPKEEGTIVYTCWMGMISSRISVVADVTKAGSGAEAGSGPGGAGGPAPVAAPAEKLNISACCGY
jgi:sulfite exporter TauE/SafE